MGDFFNPALLPSETTFFAIWLLGVSLGLTACTATCLPFMGTWILGRGGSQGQAWPTAFWAPLRVVPACGCRKRCAAEPAMPSSACRLSLQESGC